MRLLPPDGPAITLSVGEVDDRCGLRTRTSERLAALPAPLLARDGHAAGLDTAAATARRWAAQLVTRQATSSDGAVRLHADDVAALRQILGGAAQWRTAADRQHRAPARLAARLGAVAGGLRTLLAQAHAGPDPAVTTLGHPTPPDRAGGGGW